MYEWLKKKRHKVDKYKNMKNFCAYYLKSFGKVLFFTQDNNPITTINGNQQLNKQNKNLHTKFKFKKPSITYDSNINKYKKGKKFIYWSYNRIPESLGAVVISKPIIKRTNGIKIYDMASPTNIPNGWTKYNVVPNYHKLEVDIENKNLKLIGRRSQMSVIPCNPNALYIG